MCDELSLLLISNMWRIVAVTNLPWRVVGIPTGLVSLSYPEAKPIKGYTDKQTFLDIIISFIIF
jgi:hypothetical protein